MTEKTPTDKTAASKTPTWVKAFGIVGVLLVVMVVVMLATGHGPGHHH